MGCGVRLRRGRPPVSSAHPPESTQPARLPAISGKNLRRLRPEEAPDCRGDAHPHAGTEPGLGGCRMKRGFAGKRGEGLLLSPLRPRGGASEVTPLIVTYLWPSPQFSLG